MFAIESTQLKGKSDIFFHTYTVIIREMKENRDIFLPREMIEFPVTIYGYRRGIIRGRNTGVAYAKEEPIRI